VRAGPALSDDGYTLVEMMAAVAIISLAMVGLAEGLHVIGASQARTSDAIRHGARMREADQRLEALLSNAGPFARDNTSRFAGTSDAFSFNCGPSRCAASLSPLPAGIALRIDAPDGPSETIITARQARFEYEGVRRSGAHWPSDDPRPDRLARLSLLADDGPVASVRLWTQQPRRCEFDPVILACRSENR